MASVEQGNQFRSPTATDSLPSSGTTTTENPWKKIAWEWEKLRPIYVLLVGLAGLPFAGMFGLFVSIPAVVLLSILYGLLANLLYMLGPILDMYAHWLTEPLAQKNRANLLVRAIYGDYFRVLLFIVGLLFAIRLTLAIGFNVVGSTIIPNQD